VQGGSWVTHGRSTAGKAPFKSARLQADGAGQGLIKNAIDGHHLRKKSRPLLCRLHQAYVGLMLATESKDGSRAISVVRYGAFEVRLVEFRHCGAFDASSFWIELYRHDTKSSLDRNRCNDLDDVETTAENLISRARQLHEMRAKPRLFPPSR
jgi:hypothetical protein